MRMDADSDDVDSARDENNEIASTDLSKAAISGFMALLSWLGARAIGSVLFPNDREKK